MALLLLGLGVNGDVPEDSLVINAQTVSLTQGGITEDA